MIFTKSLLVAFLMSTLLLFSFGTFDAQGADIAVKQMDQTVDAMDEQKEADKDWAEDIDKKLDMTIKVLKVIKEEVKEDQKDQALAGQKTDATQEEQLGSKIGRWVAKMNRIWRKLQEATKDEGQAPQAAREEDLIDDKEISDKLGQAIDMMSSIKKELDKDREEESSKP